MIIKSEIAQQTSTTGEGAEKKTEVRSYPKIAYQYQVGGKDFECTKISFVSPSGNASQLVSRYPRGKTVRVYFNPDKPKQAVLVPGGTELNIVPYIFAGAFILIGVGSAVNLRKKTMALG